MSITYKNEGVNVGNAWRTAYTVPASTEAVAYSALFGNTYGGTLLASLRWLAGGSTPHNIIAGVSTANASSTNLLAGRMFLQAGDVLQVKAADNYFYPVEAIASIVNFTPRAMANNGTLRVVVGDDGKIYTSTDGLAWTARTSGTAVSLYSVAHQNGLWLAGGISGGVLLTSADGLTWVVQTSNMTGMVLCFAYGAGVWAAGGETGKISTSPDGATWTAQTSGHTNTIRGMAFSPTLTMFATALDTGKVRTSADGVTWAEQAGAPAATTSMVYDGTNFVAGKTTVGSYYSADGVTWTAAAVAASPVRFLNSRLLGVAGNSIYESTDHGASWVVLGKFSATDMIYVSGGFECVSTASSNQFRRVVDFTSDYSSAAELTFSVIEVA